MEWIKTNKYELEAQATKFSNGISTLGTGLSLTAGEITAFGTALTIYDQSLMDWDAALAVVEAASEKFKTDRAAMVKLMRTYNKRMQSSPNITNQKRADIGLPIPGGSTTVTPKVVTQLIAAPFSNGSVKLSWNRSGNARTVVFVIQSSSDAVEWEYVGNTNKVSIELTGFTPGEQQFFRVVATREALSALPSEAVVIYPSGGTQSLTIAA